MNDNDLKQWKLSRCENHAGFEWVKKYLTRTLLLPTGVEKPILCRLEAPKGGEKNAPKHVGRAIHEPSIERPFGK